MTDRSPFADRRKGRLDRRASGRRTSDSWSGSVRFAGWNEQLVQFLTRYLFIALALVFFSSVDGESRTHGYQTCFDIEMRRLGPLPRPQHKLACWTTVRCPHVGSKACISQCFQ